MLTVTTVVEADVAEVAAVAEEAAAEVAAEVVARSAGPAVSSAT